MEAQILEWLTLLVRWLHVITAIAWIGASFYFIWLDLSLQTPRPDSRARGLKGELWAIHGGGIYEVGKYESHPTPMPERLHWFKWEAYSTWLTGTLLLILIYYIKADAYLVGANLWVTTPMAAVAASIGYLAAGLALYELINRVLARSVLMEAIGITLLTALLSWVAFASFAPRAAILHVGAVLATMMAANVFLVIIPSQKAFVRAIERDEEPDLQLSVNAKKRSTHNNYLTLPVLFCMLSNHAAFIYGHPHAWVSVVAFSSVAAFARHFFNEKHSGRRRPGILITAALLFIALGALHSATRTGAGTSTNVSSSRADSLVARHCSGCHAEQPTTPGFTAPPAGLIFTSAADLQQHRQRAVTSLQTQFMPLGNLTGMTAQERAELLAFTQRPSD